MNASVIRLGVALGGNGAALRSIAAPLVILLVLGMMVLPLPSFALDILFTVNIALALMVMLVAAQMIRPLDFAAFPAVLLITTLLRLSLNVASTRVVLMDGHTGPAAAGAVIESFGHFLIGGDRRDQPVADLEAQRVDRLQVDAQRGGDLLARIKGVRKKFAQDVGFLPPPVHIRDNLELKPSLYRLTLRGAVAGEGEAYPGLWLAINLGQTQALIEHMTRLAPKLIEDVIPKMVGTATVQKTLQLLLEEGVHIRDMRYDVLAELRSMRGLIEERFSALAFMEKLQRQPGQARLASRLLDAGFSPALIKKLVEALPQDVADESAWAAGVLARNLPTAEAEPALEDQGGIYALIGSTGVGKTTSTAKIAAAFATRHGCAALGLITLDAFRVAAHEQLRAYGRILGVPVHTAHDRASLEDLLDLLAAKKMVLIDTAGTAQRDARTRELLDMVSHRTIHKLLVINAAAQGETIDDVMTAYRAAACRGAVLSKIDEAVKLGPALDALIRHKLPVLGVANGQRVPEDWHRLSSHALVQRALRERPATPWRLDAADMNLVFAGRAPPATALHA